MADLRSRFIEDYAGGILNISRQEFSTTGEVASQDGLPTDGKALYVEDGSGNKSGLKLGLSIAEVVDPTTEEGCVNVRYADRTYASQRDLKLLGTALASTQSALVDSVATSLNNLETAFELMESDSSSLQTVLSNLLDQVSSIADNIADLQSQMENNNSAISNINTQLNDLSVRLRALEGN